MKILDTAPFKVVLITASLAAIGVAALALTAPSSEVAQRRITDCVQYEPPPPTAPMPA